MRYILTSEWGASMSDFERGFHFQIRFFDTASNSFIIAVIKFQTVFSRYLFKKARPMLKTSYFREMKKICKKSDKAGLSLFFEIGGFP